VIQEVPEEDCDQNEEEDPRFQASFTVSEGKSCSMSKIEESPDSQEVTFDVERATIGCKVDTEQDDDFIRIEQKTLKNETTKRAQMSGSENFLFNSPDNFAEKQK
jgi:hypothetical protein